MPTLRRHRSDSNAQLRSSLAEAAWAVEDRVVWGTADLLREAADAVERPFDRVSSAFQQWVLWPVDELTAGWSDWLRRVGLAAICALAVGAVAAGIALSSSGGDTGVEAAAPISVAAASPTTAAPKTAVAPGTPLLHGVKPDFKSSTGAPATDGTASSAASVPAATANDAATVVKSSPSSPPASKADEQVAGPAAMDVAHRFAEAFVLYEVGRSDAKVRTVFAATTSPTLTQALLKRPPRLPANVKVPEARVLNIVPGPKQGNAYTLSVSLLRVGVTSELRIDMQRDKSGRWQVTDVLG
jgi:hypothetical protein